MNVLVTSGGTAEPVDGVRFLTNFSTGHTAAVLARELQKAGHTVHLLRARRAENVPEVEQSFFTDFRSLDEALRALLAQRDFDLIVHAAAVADFAVESVQIDGRDFVPAQLAKIHGASEVRLLLKPTYKIIDRLPSYARRRPLIVGFKLTNGASAVQAQQAAARVCADWVVQNDLKDIQSGRRIFSLYWQGQKMQEIEGTVALAAWLGQLTAAEDEIFQTSSNLI